MPVSSTPLYEKQQTKENNVPYKESGMSGRGVGERNRSYCATVLFSRLHDCLETLGGSWGKGVPDFLLRPFSFHAWGQWGELLYATAALPLREKMGEPGGSDLLLRAIPSTLGDPWVPGGPTRCEDVTSEPLLTPAFPHFALPLTTPVCLSHWTLFFLFSLLPLLILLPHYPPPSRVTAYLISDCLAITLYNFVLCLYPVITLQTSSPEKWQPSFTIFFSAWMAVY